MQFFLYVINLSGVNFAKKYMILLNFWEVVSSKIFENDLLTQRRKREKMSQNNAKIKIRVDAYLISYSGKTPKKSKNGEKKQKNT